MSAPLSPKASARIMRDRAETYKKIGWVRNNFWLSPEAVETLDQLRVQMGYSNREMTVNAILDRIGEERRLGREPWAPES
jgi:hypothetical protein